MFSSDNWHIDTASKQFIIELHIFAECWHLTNLTKTWHFSYQKTGLPKFSSVWRRREDLWTRLTITKLTLTISLLPQTRKKNRTYWSYRRLYLKFRIFIFKLISTKCNVLQFNSTKMISKIQSLEFQLKHRKHMIEFIILYTFSWI